MLAHLILIGLLAFLAAFSLWMRAKNQPEDIPMYSFLGHRRLSKWDGYIAAIGCLFMGMFFVWAGLTF
jgi:hypothetical protein